MNRIDKIKVGEIEIICIDYCNLTQDQMIALESEAAELILTGNKAVYVVNRFNEKNYASPKVVRHFEHSVRKLDFLIKKMTFVGLSPNKKIILKGFNLILNREFQAFDTQEEAIAYLL